MPIGPCIVCGAMNYSLSIGGPNICPTCDCGPPKAADVRKLREFKNELQTQLATSQAEAQVLKEKLVVAKELLKICHPRCFVPSIKAFLANAPDLGLCVVQREDLERLRYFASEEFDYTEAASRIDQALTPKETP